MSALVWKRDGVGRQVTECGRYAVQVDGYKPGRWIESGISYGDGGEWAAIKVAGDENLDWFPTMREAKAACEDHAFAHTIVSGSGVAYYHSVARS